MTIIFVLWCLGLHPTPTRVVEYPTEAACVAAQREGSGLVLDMSKAVVLESKRLPKGETVLQQVAYVCMAEVKR